MIDEDGDDLLSHAEWKHTLFAFTYANAWYVIFRNTMTHSLWLIVYDLLSRMAMKGFDENKNNALDSDERTQFIYYLKVINYNL